VVVETSQDASPGHGKIALKDVPGTFRKPFFAEDLAEFAAFVLEVEEADYTDT
jgi:hypothetical protein